MQLRKEIYESIEIINNKIDAFSRKNKKYVGVYDVA